ncbi:MAG: galactose oxidase early set domain-containing protein, partial [Thermoleophilaceae bacterium]
GAQPVIRRADGDVGYGGRTSIDVDVPASRVESVVLVRNPTLTHLVDGDQRNVELPVVARSGHRVTVAGPPDGNVAPPGPYMLFVNKKTPAGLVPSVSKQLFLRP